MDILDRVPGRSMKIIKQLEHLTYQEMLKELGVFSPEKGRLREAL